MIYRIGFGKTKIKKKIIKRKKMKKVIIFSLVVVVLTACSTPKVEENYGVDSTGRDSTLVLPIDSIKTSDSIVVDSTKK